MSDREPDSSHAPEPPPDGTARGGPLTPALTGPPEVPGELVVRQPRPEEEDRRRAAVDASFGSPFHPHTPQEAEGWDALAPLANRILAAERAPDGSERIVGGATHFDSSLSLPGGGRVPVAALSGVGVAPGEQGHGAFRALIGHHLDGCRARGEAASVLMASQTPLYGRFGYGCATDAASWEIDAPEARRLLPGAPTSGRVTLEHGRGPQLLDLLREVWEAAGSVRGGSLARSAAWWERILAPTRAWMGGGGLLVGLHWLAGRCDGYVLYDVDIDHGRSALAEATITIRELVAVDVAAELDLWRFVAELPWARTVRWTYGPIDPASLFWLVDTRALRRSWQVDFLWVRPLDLVALTRGRTFVADGSVRLAVTDRRYPDLSGRFDLVVDAGAGQWLPGSGPAQLELSVADLGAVWLGGVSALRLHGARRITGEARAAAALDALLAVAQAPRSLSRF